MTTRRGTPRLPIIGCTTTFTAEVGDDFSDDWTGEHDRDEEVRNVLIESWREYGDHNEDIYDAESTTADDWRVKR